MFFESVHQLRKHVMAIQALEKQVLQYGIDLPAESKTEGNDQETIRTTRKRLTRLGNVWETFGKRLGNVWETSGPTQVAGAGGDRALGLGEKWWW